LAEEAELREQEKKLAEQEEEKMRKIEEA